MPDDYIGEPNLLYGLSSPRMMQWRDKFNEFINSQDTEDRYRRDKTVPEGDAPYVPHPAIFQPDPKVIGPPQFSKLAKWYYDSNPVLKENLVRMGLAPTKGVFDQMLEAGIDPYRYAHTNLMGNTDNTRDKGIYINPRYPDSMNSTMAHELTHSRGWGEIKASVTEELLKYYLDPDKNP